MKLFSTSPSQMFYSIDNVTITLPIGQPNYNFEQIKWNEEISVEEAFSRIEKIMYPFKEVIKYKCT